MLFYYSIDAQVENPTIIINSTFSKKEKIEKIDSLLKVFSKEKKDSIHFYYSDYALWLYNTKEVDKAIINIRKAIYFVKTKSIIDSAFIQKKTLDIGIYLRRKNKPLKAIKYLNEVLEINDKNKYAIKAYYLLGYSYVNINNYDKALNYFETAFNLLKSNKNNNKLLINTCISMAYICINNGNLERYSNGIEYCKMADSLSSISTTSLGSKYLIKLNLATLYNQHEFLDIKNSFKYYKQALEIAKQKKDTFKIAQTLLWIGNLYNTTDYNKSLNYTDKALEACSKVDSINLRQIHYFYSLTHARGKAYKKSIAASHKSFTYLIGNDLKNHKDFDKKTLINSKSKRILLEMLPSLAETYLKFYEETKNPILLEKSIAYFKLADYTLDLIKINSDEYTSKLFWQKMSTDIYGKAIRACYLSNNATDAFYFMEKNKALLLMEDIATQNYRQSLEVPISSLEKEKQLKREIFTIKNTIESYNTVNSTLDSLKKVLLDSNRELLTLQDSIYGGKQKLKATPRILSLQEVQQNCKANEVKIEYHISIDDGYGIYSNNENGYGLFITKDKYYFFEIANQILLKKKSLQLINSLKTPFKTGENIKNYTKTAYTVFNTLFPTHQIKELIKNKKLTIVADSYLALLPFEALNTKENTLHYLINESETSYLYSYSFLHNQHSTQSQNRDFLGIAPNTFNYDGLSPLDNSEDEILNLDNYFKGSILINEKATKKEFLKQLNNYSIIHLATHANAQDSINPWIAFRNKKLSLPELYLTQNEASLVVLSGCNTTLGKEEIGEGIMSLARGFFYSGSQSVMSSLWSVDNTSTPILMNDFYKNLYNGQTKSESLHNAKLNYLENHSLSEASPHYWASFILLGEDTVIKSSTNQWWYLLWILLGLLIIFLIFKLRKKLQQIHLSFI